MRDNATQLHNEQYQVCAQVLPISVTECATPCPAVSNTNSATLGNQGSNTLNNKVNFQGQDYIPTIQIEGSVAAVVNVTRSHSLGQQGGYQVSQLANATSGKDNTGGYMLWPAAHVFIHFNTAVFLEVRDVGRCILHHCAISHAVFLTNNISAATASNIAKHTATKSASTNDPAVSTLTVSGDGSITLQGGNTNVVNQSGTAKDVQNAVANAGAVASTKGIVLCV